MPIFYVFSNKSHWDIVQSKYTAGCVNVRCIEFNSPKHGIPFLKVALPVFINKSTAELEEMVSKKHHPVWFTIECVGWYKAMRGFIEQAYQSYKKRH